MSLFFEGKHVSKRMLRSIPLDPFVLTSDRCEFYGINNEDQHLIRYKRNKDQFRVFIRGFKLLFIHEGGVIRHVYIDDSYLDRSVEERNLKAMVSYLLRGRSACMYVITSDIHLQYFHMQLITQFGRDTRVGQAIINGDIFYKCLSFEQEGSSRVRITDVFIDYVNKELVPLLDNESVIWIRGNHDTKSAWTHSSLAHIPTRWKKSKFMTITIGDIKFYVTHKPPMDVTIEGIYDYLILGHSCGYMLRDEVVDDYIANNYRDLYVNNLYSFQYVPHDTFESDGLYRFLNMRLEMEKEGDQLTFRYNDNDETQVNINDGPIYISPYRKKSEAFHYLEFGRERLEYVALDLIYVSEMCRIYNNDKLICLNNIRATNALFPNDNESDFPEFKSFGYFEE